MRMYSIDIKKLRKDKKLTQIEMANILNCKQPFISALESGASQLPSDMLTMLNEYFGDISTYIISKEDHESTMNVSAVIAEVAEQRKLTCIAQEQLSKAQEQMDRLIAIIERITTISNE